MAASTEPTGPGAPSRGGALPALETGDVLADRYRLAEPVVTADGLTTLWRATDEVLARPVAVRLLPASGRAGKAAAAPFLAAAGRASALSHPGLARVYDASLEACPTQRSGRTVDVAYVVSEWVDGRTLVDVLAADGPLEPADAIRLTMQAAEAVAEAHARGVAHGRLHPGNLLVDDSGRLRVTDVAVAAALHGQEVDAAVPLSTEAARRDTRDLGAALYAMLTARWPAGSTEQPSAGVPDAPRASGGALVYSPRQVRAGVPRPLDALVVRTLDPKRAPTLPVLGTPLALVQALDEVELRPVEPPAATKVRRERRDSRWRRAWPKLAALAFIGAVGVGFYQAGQQVGQLPRREGAIDELVEPSAQPAAGGAAGTAIDLTKPPVKVRDFDPGSRDGTEQPGSVPNSYDGDSSTAWMTDGYRSPTFGGLKPGVGLLIDLGKPTVVASVKVGLTVPGADVELRAAGAPGRTAADYTVVARAPGAKQVADLKPSTATPSRFWLVWITKLPKAEDGRFREGVAELVFTRGG